MVGMKVGHKCYFQIARFDCCYSSIEGSGLGPPHNAGSKIDKVGAVVYNNDRRRAGAIRIRHRSSRAE
jgi:hypothetical protein